MKRPLTLFLIFVASGAIAQQKPDLERYIKSQSKRIDVVLQSTQLHQHDTVADIGAGKGRFDVLLGLHTDSLVFDLEEIDTSSLTTTKIAGYQSSFNALKPGGITNKYSVHYGTIATTGLPSNRYNKVFVFDVYHHIDDKPTFLQDIKRIMKPGSKLIVCEMIGPRPGYIYKPCNKTLYTIDELVTAFIQQGFEFEHIYKTVNAYGMRVRYFRFAKQ